MRTAISILLLLSLSTAGAQQWEAFSELMRTENGNLILTGSAQIIGPNLTLSGNTLHLTEDNQAVIAQGSPANLVLAGTAGNSYVIKAPEIIYARDLGTVKLTLGGTLRSADLNVSAGRIIYSIEDNVLHFDHGFTLNAANFTAQGISASSRLSSQLESLHLSGNPARFESFADDLDVSGEAEQIDYFPSKQRLELRGNAIVRRQDEELAGAHIVYELEGNIFTAKPKPGERVRMILQTP